MPISELHDEILEGLLEYTRFPHGQGFGVVLNGPWGSGKTQFIKKHMDAFVRERPGEVKQRPLYVSLYGLSDVSQIDDRLFEQLHPILSHKFTKLIGAFLRGAAKTAIKFDVTEGLSLSGSTPEMDLLSMLKNTDGRVVIFDDFERANISPSEILGYINPLVEHEDCKVIILADEMQFKAEVLVEYMLRKEKTIGRTFEFKPDVSGAYEAFLQGIDDASARVFLANSSETIHKIFADSKFDNLRLLKQYMWDFERVWKVLTPEQREWQIALVELMELLCASALELRQGLTSENFHSLFKENLATRRSGQNKASDGSPVKLQDKYPSVRFDNMVLDVDTIVDIVSKSKVSGEIIREQFGRHPYYRKNDAVDIPSWRVLWTAADLSPTDQGLAVARFQNDFDARTFGDVDVIYHVFGLGLWLSALGFPGWEAEKIEEKLKRYVIDVYALRQPTVADAVQDTPVNVVAGAYGLGFRQSEHLLFSKLTEWEQSHRLAWKKRGYPEIASSLRDLAPRDGEQFMRLVCFTAGGPATYATIGVLKFIQPQTFASVVVGARYREQTKIMLALSLRYEQVSGYEELREETSWLREFQKYLSVEAERLPPIGREALRDLSRHYLDKAIQYVCALDARQEIHTPPRNQAPSAELSEVS